MFFRKASAYLPLMLVLTFFILFTGMVIAANSTVIVSQNASYGVKASAAKLADYLGRITGSQFQVKIGNGTAGIAVGVYTDFPDLTFDVQFNPHEISEREAYLLKSHSQGVQIIGATEMGVQHGVWDFLYRLGYRQFFPTESWEYIPELENLNLDLDVYEVPDYYVRNGPHSGTYSDPAIWSSWHERNRMARAFNLRSTHIYQQIYSENQTEFEAHPEYLALINGKRRHDDNVKFCISNQGLRQLVVKWAIQKFCQDPQLETISMEPSDGGDNWCQCEDCAVMGTVSNRVVSLANEVAEALNAKFGALGGGDKYVGIYAYSSHSPPPNVQVHPKVIVSVATSYIKEGYTVDQLIEGWSGQGATLGIYEYYDVPQWSWSKPLSARGGNVNYLSEIIPSFYQNGVRFLNGESSDSWGANGLGYYLSARLLWDINANVSELIDDFFDKAFGTAQEPMRGFYQVVAENYGFGTGTKILVGRMYRYLDQALSLTEDPRVKARLKELVLYTRYVELIYDYDMKDKNDQAAAEAVFRHAYRMRETMMVNVRGLYNALRTYSGANVTISTQDPGNLKIGSSAVDDEPWKSSQPFTDTEIIDLLADGIANNEVVDFDLNFRTELWTVGRVPEGLVNVSEMELNENGVALPGQFAKTANIYSWQMTKGGAWLFNSEYADEQFTIDTKDSGRGYIDRIWEENIVLQSIAYRTNPTSRVHTFEFYYFDLEENDWKLLLHWDGELFGAPNATLMITLNEPVTTNQVRLHVIKKAKADGAAGTQDGWANLYYLAYFAEADTEDN